MKSNTIKPSQDKTVEKIYLDKIKKKLLINGDEFPLTQHNGELWYKWQLTKDEELLKRFSKITLEI